MTFNPIKILSLDTSSPTSSVALATCGAHATSTIEAQWSSPEPHSSRRLLSIIDDLLASCTWSPADLDGLVGLAGPGSFTGARVGLATLYGLHQSLGAPAIALPSTLALSHLATATSNRILAVVDALRDEWYAEEFSERDRLHPQAPPRLISSREIIQLRNTTVIGFGVERLAVLGPTPTCHLEPASALATVVPVLLTGPGLGTPEAWDSSTLLNPIYARPPAMLERRTTSR